jgi:serine/threonine-protein kinase
VSELVARILEREPDWTSLPAATPPRVRELLRRCLRKDAEARPRDMRDVRLELEQVAAGAPESGKAREKSIAVLPFENLSGPDDEYFSDGMTDEILNALAHLQGLRVAARTSCFAFKGRRENLRVVGEKLDVDTVLEGSVRRAGARIRITVQLANAADGYQLWSERYDREMTDVFELQDEIAEAVATRLRGTLHGPVDGSGPRRGTHDLEAYELFLKGRALQNKRGRFMPEAIECLERAIALDPNYAEAMAWLSNSYRLMGTFGTAPPREAMPKAKQIAERALAIDSSLAEAWATIACVVEQYERDFEGASQVWERALATDPRHGRSRIQRALWAYCRGSFSGAEAAAEADRAVREDPFNSWVGAMNSYLLGMAGSHEESIAEAERALSLDAESDFARWNLVRGHSWAGRYERALEMMPALLRESGRSQWALGLLAWTYGKAGRAGASRAAYDEIEARSRHEFMSSFWLATAAAAAGLMDQAIGYIERAVAERDPLVLWANVTPFWDTLRAHRAFAAAVRPVWGSDG